MEPSGGTRSQNLRNYDVLPSPLRQMSQLSISSNAGYFYQYETSYNAVRSDSGFKNPQQQQYCSSAGTYTSVGQRNQQQQQQGISLQTQATLSGSHVGSTNLPRQQSQPMHIRHQHSSMQTMLPEARIASSLDSNPNHLSSSLCTLPLTSSSNLPHQSLGRSLEPLTESMGVVARNSASYQVTSPYPVGSLQQHHQATSQQQHLQLQHQQELSGYNVQLSDPVHRFETHDMYMHQQISQNSLPSQQYSGHTAVTAHLGHDLYNSPPSLPLSECYSPFNYELEYSNNCDMNQQYQDYYYSSDGNYQFHNGYTDTNSESLLDSNQLSSHAARCPTPFADEIVEDLGPEEVRWFYKVEADKKWTPFIGYDSLRIEWKYRDLLQYPEGVDEKDSPYGQDDRSNVSSPKSSSSSAERESFLDERIVVRGGLYEVDVKKRRGVSIYWQGESFAIARGIWFYDGTWNPVEEKMAERIEIEHLNNFRGHHVLTQRSDDSTKQVVYSLSFPDAQVDWFTASEVYLSSDGTPSRLMRSVSKKLGFQKTGYKLHRGYSLDATSSDKPPDITHLVFVIHGIGQKMETGRIIKNCTTLRENIIVMKQKYFPSLSNCGHTVEFFPVEWRSSLILDAGLIEAITPHKILNLRQMLNASFMDIMYYNSPTYRNEITNGLRGEMNRLYTMFTQRNPYFEANGGKVSIVAHSLGCVITYDIVTGWNPVRQYDQFILQKLSEKLPGKDSKEMEETLVLERAIKNYLEQQDAIESSTVLNFKIENFFCLGSPLAVFLALRTKRTNGLEPEVFPPGFCRRLLNIFHPSDPVAYRIEPLLCSHYSSVSPMPIHSYNSADKTPYGDIPVEPITTQKDKDKDGKDSKEKGDKSRPESEANTPSSSVPSTPNKSGSSSWSWWGLMKGTRKASDQSPITQDSASLQNLPAIPERIDFVLREGSMESSYISALTSHTAYWTNLDVAHFFLNILYPDAKPSSGKLDSSRT